jgi:hypothetical protein
MPGEVVRWLMLLANMNPTMKPKSIPMMANKRLSRVIK